MSRAAIVGRRIGCAAGSLSAAVALIVSCTTTTAGRPIAHSGGEPASPTLTSVAAPSALPLPSVSDEEQIRRVLGAIQDAYNNEDWDAYLQLLCPTMRDRFSGDAMDAVKNTRAEQGLSYMTLLSAVVDGDSATATVEGRNEVLGTQRLTWQFRRIDGWKLCIAS